MPSAKLSALVDLAGGQVPGDLAYIVDVSAGVAGSKKSSLNDLFSTVTKNITDVSVQFQNAAGVATVSAAGQGKLAYNNTALAFQASINGAAYANVALVAGSTKQVQFNNAGVLGGATGFEYQSGASPNVLITEQNDAHIALSIVTSSASAQTVSQFVVRNPTSTRMFEINLGGNITTQTFDKISFVTPAETGMGIWAAANTGEKAFTNYYSGTAGTDFLQVGHVAVGAGNTTLLDQARSGLIYVNSIAGLFVVAGNATGVIVFATGGTATTNERARIDSSGLFGINKASSIGAQLHVVSGAAARVGLIVDSAATPSVDIAQFRNNTSSTVQFAIKQDGMFTYPGVKILTSDFSAVATTAYATITGFSVDVRAGRSYIIKVVLRCSLDGTGLGKVRFSGTATMTNFACQYTIVDNITNAFTGAQGAVAFNGDITEGFAGTNTLFFAAYVSCQVLAAGTLTVQFAQQVASGTSTVNAFPSQYEVIEVQ